MNLPTSQLYPFSYVITLCIMSRAIHQSIEAGFVCPEENFRHHIEYEIEPERQNRKKKNHNFFFFAKLKKKNHNLETKMKEMKGTNN